MSEMTLGYYTPFNMKIQVHEYKKWQSLWSDLKACCAYGGPDGTMNFWVVYEGYIYYGNDEKQLSKIKKILDYRQSCCEAIHIATKRWESQ